MQNALFDRRQKRSQDRGKALCYQLEATRVRSSLEAVILADERGELIASAGDPAVCRELGVTVPMMSGSIFGTRLPALVRGGRVAVKDVSLGGRSLYLAVVGDATERALDHSASAVLRILRAS